jgi:hypothetical protein
MILKRVQVDNIEGPELGAVSKMWNLEGSYISIQI